jgi:hypothetical protein
MHTVTTQAIIIEGAALQALATRDWIAWEDVVTNDVVEVYKVLGLAAARAVLFTELDRIVSYDGGYVDARHLAQIVASITHRGCLTRMTRHGINRVDNSVLHRASYEEPVDMLLQGAMQGVVDPLRGVCESIYAGVKAPVGTGTVAVQEDEPDPRAGPVHVPRVSVGSRELWGLPGVSKHMREARPGPGPPGVHRPRRALQPGRAADRHLPAAIAPSAPVEPQDLLAQLQALQGAAGAGAVVSVAPSGLGEPTLAFASDATWQDLRQPEGSYGGQPLAFAAAAASMSTSTASTFASGLSLPPPQRPPPLSGTESPPVAPLSFHSPTPSLVRSLGSLLQPAAG